VALGARMVYQARYYSSLRIFSWPGLAQGLMQ